MDDFDWKIDVMNGVLDVGCNLKVLNYEVYDLNLIIYGFILVVGDVVMLEVY